MRLIDADALMDMLKKRTSTAYPNELWGLMLAQDFIEDAPTIEAAPVVHGRWIRYEHGSGIYCSRCKHKRRYKDEHDNYCPNCGAKMDGERKCDG